MNLPIQKPVEPSQPQQSTTNDGTENTLPNGLDETSQLLASILETEVQNSHTEESISISSAKESQDSSSLAPPQLSVKPPTDKGSYSDRTERIHAIVQFLKALKPFIWAFIILIVFIPLLGKLITGFSASSRPDKPPDKPPIVIVEPSPKLGKLDQGIVDALESARNTAKGFASKELDTWETEMVPRVDNFLDWYFDYFNQKKMEFSVPFTFAGSSIRKLFQPDAPGPKEALIESMTADFQREFAKRVLVPKSAQLRLELITKGTVDLYISELDKNINSVRNKYKVPQGQWDRYLSDMATTINDTEGNISNLSLKVLVGGSGYLVTKPLVAITVGKISSKMTAKMAGKAAAKMAAKTGASVAAELGTSLIDPLVGVGILLWDVWDYNHTVATDRPVVRDDLLAYLKDVKKSLLTDTETGVMSAIYQVQANLITSLHKSS